MGNKLNSKQLARFYSNMANYINSGIPLERCIAVQKKGQKGMFFMMLEGLQFHLSQGGTLWEGMSNSFGFFDEFQAMTVKAGEESGHLSETCRGLSSYYELRDKEKKRLMASMAYPVLLLHGIILLPPLKYLVLDNLNESYWSIVLPPLIIAYGLIGLVCFSWNRFLKSGKARERIDGIILNMPGFRKLVKGIALVRILRALYSMYNAGIEPVRAVRQSIQTSGNKALAKKMLSALPILEEGGTFSNFFIFTGVLEPIQMSMITAGEVTGTLGDSLEKLVEQMEEDNRYRLEKTVKMVGGIIYAIAALAVAITVASFYSDYFVIG